MSRLAPILRALLVAAAVTVPSTPLVAQDDTPVPSHPMPPIQRVVLQTSEVQGTGTEAVLVLAEFAPNVAAGPHTHPGPATAYVIYGSIEVVIDGEAPRTYRAGESFTVPADTVHDERTSAAGAKVVASFIVPAGVPLANPVE
jgi:quercetin dioxygenase-like cupin family protein